MHLQNIFSIRIKKKTTKKGEKNINERKTTIIIRLFFNIILLVNFVLV